MSRETWLSFLSRADLGSRYLWPSTFSQIEAYRDEESARKFVEMLAENDVSARHLGLVYYLLKPSLGRFTADLPRILKTLRHSSERSFDDKSYSVRGKVDWQRTFKGRINGGVPVGAVSVARHTKIYDTLENRLLKLFLRELSAAIGEISKAIGNSRLPEVIEQIKTNVESALSSAYLVEISDVRHANIGMVTAVLRSRSAHYRELGRLWLSFEDALILGKLSGLLDLISEGWLAPISDDDLFELYVLALTIDVGMHELGFGQPKTVDVVRSGRGAVAEFKDGDRQLKVFFNQSPTTIMGGSLSKYRSLVSAHRGIVGSERRPDIILHFKGIREATIFIECKNTTDDRYIRESIYKCFGYLYDFEDFLSGDHSPKGIAYFQEGIRLETARENYTGDLVAASDRAGLAAMLMSSISFVPDKLA
ncbi:MAG: hypothetical protein CFE28_03895 [Alphaproteobacteria bacterium PA2]|nr:MAG: hypothetical protein CFE28_03895 [Alphaproteobacteria bacterium PA2]